MQANDARRWHAMMGNPSEKDYKGMVSNSLITDCPITLSDVTNVCAMFGPELTSNQGKTYNGYQSRW